ncbi:MAG: hypothetical protein MI741_10430 [Rhodospirillales bacterium]|nr:hypothetical protein [Rhodospirillales bacterium]
MAQTWNPEGYRKHTGFVSDLGEPLIDLLSPRPGERVLGLGRGDGDGAWFADCVRLRFAAIRT